MLGGLGLLIGATNEKPRLRKQPGFSCDTSGDAILSNLGLFLTAPAAMIFQTNTACGDDADWYLDRLCSNFYVF